MSRAVNAIAAVIGGVVCMLDFPNPIVPEPIGGFAPLGLAWLVAREPPARWLALGLFLGHALALSWMPAVLERRFEAWQACLAWGALSAWGALFPWLALIIARATPGLARVAVLPPIWMAMEELRAGLFGGFDWLALGHAVIDVDALGPLYPIIGGRGVAGLVVALALLAAHIDRRVIAVMLGALVVAGAIPRAPSIDVRLGIATRRASIAADARALAAQGASFVVAPEGFFGATPERVSSPVPVLAGAQLDCGLIDRRRCIANAVVRADGRAHSYEKRYLVPLWEADFGPLRARPDIVMRAGEAPGLFELGDLRVGVAICYDVLDAGAMRELAALAPDVIVHPTSDAWHDDPLPARQHLAVARVRAAEYGVAFVRVSDRGFDALARPDGTTAALTLEHGRGLVTAPRTNGVTNPLHPALMIGAWLLALILYRRLLP